MHRSTPAAPLPNGRKVGKSHVRKRSQSEAGLRTISPDGDLVLVCIPSGAQQSDSKQTEYSVRVSSAALSKPRSYFASLLDPEKFQEGRAVRETNSRLSLKYGSHDEAMRLADVAELARVSVELPPVATKLSRAALVETFFRMVVFSGGLGASEDEEEDEGDSLHRLADLPIPFLASLAVISDRFGVVPLFREALGFARIRSKEGPGGGLSRLLRRLRTYESENEGRLRQAIYLSLTLEDTLAVRCTTQGLIIKGSREWLIESSGQHVAGIDRAIWWYFPMGIEEELSFRHQCILNTIADLQNHFLRAYGAFPATPGQQSYSSPRQLQCSRAYGNSHACDCFHLGEIIRFFSSRTKTMLIESSIADPDLFSDDEGNNEPNGHVEPPPSTGPNLTLPQPSTSASPPTSISSLISTLRQCPEYQIDPNHAGCGMRRRLIPALDFVENFTNSHSHVLGICLRHWSGDARSWRDKMLSRPLKVCVSKSGIIEAAQWKKGRGLCDCISNAEDARAIFCARERRWNL